MCIGRRTMRIPCRSVVPRGKHRFFPRLSIIGRIVRLDQCTIASSDRGFENPSTLVTWNSVKNFIDLSLMSQVYRTMYHSRCCRITLLLERSVVTVTKVKIKISIVGGKIVRVTWKKEEVAPGFGQL